MREERDGGRRQNSHLPSASLGHYAALSFVVKGRRQTKENRSQKSEVSGQRAASQIVNLSNSQMVMNGLNDELTI